MSDPTKGFVIDINKGMTDIRWHQKDGWVKKGWRYDPEGIEIHFVAQIVNDIIVAVDDFKFK